MSLFRRSLMFMLTMVLLMGAAVSPSLGQATADQYYQAGLQLYTAKDYTRAIQYFDAALKMDPNNIGALRGAGNCYVSLNQPAQALPYYEKALAANPSDTQLAQFVESLKAQAGSAAPAATGAADPAAAAPATGAAYAQGKALFDQKQYAAAIPLFQQALTENPLDANAHYYLGYSQYVSGDKKNAALSFARTNRISPNATADSYAQRIRATLSPEEALWVDAELAKGLATTAAKPATAPAKKKSFGIRLVGGLQKFTLGDLKTDSDAKLAYTAILQEDDPSIGLEGNIPSGGLVIAVEPFVPMGNSFELGLHFETLGVGTYEYTISNGQPGDMEYINSASMKISAMPLGLGGRFCFSPPEKKVRPFLGFSVLYMLANIDYTGRYKHYSDPEETQSAKLKGSALGGGLSLGFDFAFGSGFKLSPFVGFRMLKVKNFKGTANDSRISAPFDAELSTTNGTGEFPAGHVILMPTNPDLLGFDPSIAGPTEVDFGGLELGAALNLYF